jgi:hypothetical protein
LWFHFDCFFKRWKGELSSDTVIKGSENLRPGDNQKLKEKLKTLYVSLFPPLTSSSYLLLLLPVTSLCHLLPLHLPFVSGPTPLLPLLLTQGSKRKAGSEGEGAPSSKKPKLDSEQENKYEKAVEEEAKLLWNIKDKLNKVDKSIIVYVDGRREREEGRGGKRERGRRGGRGEG